MQTLANDSQPELLSVREARRRYLAANGFNGSYDEAWVVLFHLGPIPVGFPNSKARVRAVRLHDLHHVATGYDTSFVGEAEIGAWEIGAGCGRHLPAWVLNSAAMALGVFLAPRRTWQAFVRGRKSLSLYSRQHFGGEFREEYLDWSVGELRAKLQLVPRATAER